MTLFGAWGAPEWLAPAGALLAIGAAALVWSYWRSPFTNASGRVALALKAVGLAALALCLVDPWITGSRPRPGANIFAILADDSQSMQIHDSGADASRGESLKRRLLAETSWQTTLGQEYDVRRLAFHSQVRAVDDFTVLKFDGASTSLTGALEAIRRRFHGLPVAGVLLLTDGNSVDPLPADMPWSGLPPIYTVACGRGDDLRDVGVEQLAATQTNFETAPVTVRADVRADGFTDEPLRGRLLDEHGKVLETQTASTREDGKASFRFQVRPEKAGVSFYEVEAIPESALAADSSAEATQANNRRLIAVDRGGGPYRVLYVSGRPNWEFKFLRRALADDNQLQLVGLVRIAKKEAKFSFRPQGQDSNRLFEGFEHPDEDAAESYDEPVLVRLGTRDEEELRDGFPRDAETLDAYDAVVLDDLEAGFFSPDQLTLLDDFVSRRGGGLLMLGGGESFVQGGYRRTPLGDALPVYLDESADESEADVEVDSPFHAPADPSYRLALTRDGWLEPWVRLRKTEPEDRERLAAMPAFHTVNFVGALKPGATVLAEVVDEQGDRRPALAAQRFGRGRTAALLVGDLFRWGLRRQGQTDDDLEKSWRQTIRWLVSDVPQRVEVDVAPAPAGSPQETVLRIRVHDAEYLPLDNALVKVEIETPDGRTVEMDAEPDAKEAGVYAATHASRVPGAYRAKLTVAGPDGAEVGIRETGWAAQPLADEFERLAPNRRLLEEVAVRTGGEVVELDDLDGFVASLSGAQGSHHRAVDSAVMAPSGLFPGSHGLPGGRVGTAAVEGYGMIRAAKEHVGALPRRRMSAGAWSGVLLGLALVVASFARGQEASPAKANVADSRPRQSIGVVLGAPGAPEYGSMFQAWADKWRTAAGNAAADFTLIGGATPKPPSDDSNDRDQLKAWIADQAHGKAEIVWLILLGHGTYDGHSANFNLRGPDVSGEEVADWLQGVSAPTVLINCSSASGPWLAAAKAPNRIVITATKSGAEVNFARFGEYLAEALVDPHADLDKDDQVSLLEAFLQASRGVTEYYEDDRRLATEHALLDDNGDGLGSPESLFTGLRSTVRARQDAPIDGVRARQIHLVPSAREAALPVEVRKRRDKLELSMARLRAQKDDLGEEPYYRELEALAIELARLYAQAQPPAGSPPSPR